MKAPGLGRLLRGVVGPGCYYVADIAMKVLSRKSLVGRSCYSEDGSTADVPLAVVRYAWSGDEDYFRIDLEAFRRRMVQTKALLLMMKVEQQRDA